MTASVKGYVLGELLGTGGMGRVYATAGSSARPVVIKLLHEALQGDPFFVNRFIEEARTARAVQHRNVVRVLDDGLTPTGLPYLVMERVAGESLGAMIRRDGPLPLQRVRHITSQITAGVGAIHRAGLLHGDLKSDNILVDAHDHVTIIDFGLARDSAPAPASSIDGMISGTPEYMAPELIDGDVLTSASEVYSIGVIVYEMLTGTTPFTGGSCTEVCMRVLSEDVVPPSLRAPDRDIPVPLETTVMRALARDPKARHLTAELLGTAVACAIPANLKETLKAPSGPVFSVTATTRNWTQQRERPIENAPIVRHRHAVADAQERGDPTAVIIAYLALAQELLHVHNAREAVRELELGIAWLEANTPRTTELWRMLVTLDALRRLSPSQPRRYR